MLIRSLGSIIEPVRLAVPKTARKCAMLCFLA